MMQPYLPLALALPRLDLPKRRHHLFVGVRASQGGQEIPEPERLQGPGHGRGDAAGPGQLHQRDRVLRVLQAEARKPVQADQTEMNSSQLVISVC